MNRIGILTFHRSVNNGAVMQAYSLSKRIASDFPHCSVNIIDYNLPSVEKSYQASLGSYFRGASGSAFLKRGIMLVLDPMQFSRIQKKREVFRTAIKQLPLSEHEIIQENTDDLKIYINQNYDLLIVGSDAVWNYNSIGFPNAYIPDLDVKATKLSYAASCYGMNFQNIDAKEKEQICCRLDQFKFIGVRDTATEQFVKWTGTKIEPIHTCDPTVLLDINDLPIHIDTLNDKLRKRGYDFSKPTIGIMGNNHMLAMIRRMFGSQYQIVSLFNYLKGADVQLYDLNPFEWAYVFRLFKLTFTTYFHGTLLSLKNGVPVICIALNTEFAKYHDPKTLDLLKRLGKQNWYFQTDYHDNKVDIIKSTAVELINHNLRDEILQALDIESNSYSAFYNSLKKEIDV